MAVADQPKYMWIPPPPLPEFYLSKEKLDQRNKSASSSTSGTEVEEKVVVKEKKKKVKVVSQRQAKSGPKDKEQPLTGDGAYDGLPLPPYRYGGPPQPFLPPPTGNGVPPLAVYHICRICLRPRSAKYHHEHPIPIDGVPPPPGICQRCRVTSVKESSEINVSEVDEVVRKGKSNDIKIGFITLFVPDEAILSNEDAKKMQAERYLRGRSRERHITIFREESRESQHRRRRSKSRRSDIVYRHIRVVEEPSPKEKIISNTAESVLGRKLDEEPRTKRRYARRVSSETRKHSTRERPPSKTEATLKSANLAKLDSTKASQSSQDSSSAGRQDATATEKSVARETVILKKPDRTDSDIRRIAGEEAQKYAEDIRKSERSESDIRRIAHEEVERYREDERKLEAKPKAFSHGRMVPAQRQIEKAKDELQPMPWKGPSQAASPVPVPVPVAKPQGSAPVKTTWSKSYRGSEGQARSNRASWGPQWRRELSLERRRSIGTREEVQRVDVEGEYQAEDPQPPSDVVWKDMPRSTRDVVRELDSAPTGATGSQQKEMDETARGTVGSTASKRDAQEKDMCFHFPPSSRTRTVWREDADRERETVERLVVRSPRSSDQRERADHRASNRSKASGYKEGEKTAVRRIVSQSSHGPETQGTRRSRRDDESSSAKPSQRGSEERAAFLADRDRSLRAGGPPPHSERELGGSREASNVQYEYELHTIRPADPSRDPPPEDPGYVTLEIWQQIPIDPEQRAREAPMHEREREDAVEYLKKRINDPAVQVGFDADGSRRVACSIFPRDEDTHHPRSPERRRRPSPLQSPPRRRSPQRRHSPEYRHHPTPQYSSRARSPLRRQPPESRLRSELRGGGERRPDREGARRRNDSPEREMVIGVWKQVTPEAARAYRRQGTADARPGDRQLIIDADLPDRESVIGAWVEEERERQASVRPSRKDSAVDTPPARRRRERREHTNRASNGSAHVEFNSKIDVSPTPPGSDESSAAWKRFHDFGSRRPSRQVDGHDSETARAEDERRGRSRSREPPRRHSGQARDSREDRDETVRPKGKQRQYDGARDEGWRPLQRALSESPSREGSGRKRSSTKGGPPYHADEKPSGSMTTRDGSRETRPWW